MDGALCLSIMGFSCYFVTGEQSKAYLFVAVLPCSYFAYAEVYGVSAQ